MRDIEGVGGERVGDLTYRVAMSPATLRTRLRQAVDEPTTAYLVVPGVVHGRRFVGRINESAFEISVRQQSYNSLAPRAYGQVTATGDGCVVSVTIGPPMVARVGIPLLIAATATGAVPVLLSVGYGLPLVAALWIALVGVAFGLWKSRWTGGFPTSEAMELREFLDEFLGMKESTGANQERLS